MIRPTTKKDQPKEYESPEVLMKKGRWSLWQEDDGSSLWHQCSKGTEEVDSEYEGRKSNRAIVVYPIGYHKYHRSGKERHTPGWLCDMCRTKPPESILSVFLIHNLDHISELTARGGYGPGGWMPGW